MHVKHKPLRGDRNQCAGCGLLFNSTRAFDRHRTGRFGVDRRCRSTPEMRAIGMQVRDDGFWVSAANPAYTEAA